MELVFTQKFQCDERSPGEEAYKDDGGVLSLYVELWRDSFSPDGMNGQLGVSMELRRDVDDQYSFSHVGLYQPVG